MAVVGFLQSLWEKPIWEGVWSHWDPMDGVCVCVFRTASVEWNVPGKYGSHGELFFSLIQREPALAPVDETFSHFFKAGICLLKCSRSARLSHCTQSRKQEEAEKMDVMLLVWGWAWWQDPSFLEGLGAGEGGFELPHGLDMLCQEMHDAW